MNENRNFTCVSEASAGADMTIALRQCKSDRFKCGLKHSRTERRFADQGDGVKRVVTPALGRDALCFLDVGFSSEVYDKRGRFGRARHDFCSCSYSLLSSLYSKFILQVCMQLLRVCAQLGGHL